MAGTITVAQLLLQDLPAPMGAADASNPSLTAKPWTANYPPVSEFSLWSPTIESINAIFAPEHPCVNDNEPMYTNDPNDGHRLGKLVYPPNYPSVEHITTEGDVVRDFCRNIAAPVQLAWNGNINFFERSESGPPGPTSATQTFDFYFSWLKGGVNGRESCMAGGELKKPRMIKASQWGKNEQMGSLGLQLGKEMRGYAYIYKCPQVFVYDGCYLLILHFKATSRENIKSANCPVDCCMIPRENIGVLRYGLYRLIWRGWMRLVGEMAVEVERPVALDDWHRSFRYYSGSPRWKFRGHGHAQEYHPEGYLRKFDLNANAWYWAINGNPVLYDDGQWVFDSWDTT